MGVIKTDAVRWSARNTFDMYIHYPAVASELNNFNGSVVTEFDPLGLKWKAYKFGKFIISNPYKLC